MNVTLEILFGIEESTSPIPAHNAHTHHPPPDTQKAKPYDLEYNQGHESGGGAITTDDENPQAMFMPPNPRHHEAFVLAEKKKAFWRTIERTLFAVLVVVVAIYVPDFSTTMAFLGKLEAENQRILSAC